MGNKEAVFMKHWQGVVYFLTPHTTQALRVVFLPLAVLKLWVIYCLKPVPFHYTILLRPMPMKDMAYDPFLHLKLCHYLSTFRAHRFNPITKVLQFLPSSWPHSPLHFTHSGDGLTSDICNFPTSNITNFGAHIWPQPFCFQHVCSTAPL